jgi:hypothetical protein
MAARTFGPGAHENAKARTGDENAVPTGADIGREGFKQAVALPLNAVGLSRIIPGIGGKVTGVGLDGAGNAMKKYLTTVGTEVATGGGRDVVNQLGTSIGQEHGASYDPNKTAEAALASGAGSGLLVAPRLAGDVGSATKFRKFGGANAEAATALADRHMEHADGEKLIGTFGGTKKAADVVHAAHSDVMGELRKASDGTELSQANQNTLDRIKSGGKASEREVSSLGDEASPEVVSLARQALLSRQLKSMGTLTDDKFTGGLSGAMERLRPISNPVGTGVAMGATALAGHAGGLGMLGTFAPHVIGGIAGAYGVSRLFDKMTGARSPAQGFTDKFASGNPREAPPITAAPEEEPYQPSLRNTLNANVKIDEGVGKIVKKLQDDKRKQMISQSLPMLKQLSEQSKPPVTTEVPAQAPEAPWAPNPIANKMLQQKLKQGLPPEPAPIEPAPAPVPQAPVDAFDALKPLMGRQRSIMRGLAASSKQQVADNAAQRKAAGIAQAEGLAADSHVINEQGGVSALSNPEFTKRGSQLLSAANVMRRLTAEPPEEPMVPEGPASPAISALMQKLQGTPAAPAAPVPEPSVAPAPSAPTIAQAPMMPEAAPVSPLIAKITKAKGKEQVKETPHPEDAFTKEHVPLTDEELWGKGLSDTAFAKKESSEPHVLMPENYAESVILDRQKRRGILADIVGDDVGPDAHLAGSLLQELHHTRRAANAASAVQHFTAKMSPKMRDAIRKRMDKSFINSMWKT